MSAQLAPTANSFSAHLALTAGVAVTITAGTLDDLAGVVAKLQGTAPANDSQPPMGGTPAAADAAVKTDKPKAAETKTESSKVDAGNASAPTPTQATAPAADSGSAGAGDALRPTYDDVKAKVLALSKKSRELAVGTLGKFKTAKGEPVDHGNKLQLEDYPAFIAAADKALA